MGRSIFIEESVGEGISNLHGMTAWTTGVLIGQFTSQRDYIVHLALTPSQNEESEDFKDDTGTEKQPLPGISTSASQAFDEEWFVQHCRQVNRMLPGGLNVLGIFVFGPPEQRNKLQVKFRQVLFSVHKMIMSDFPMKKLDCGTKEQVILQVCSATKRTTCFTIDVSDTKASVHPAEIKYQNFVSKWSSLHCSFCLELKIELEKKSINRSLYSKLKAGLLPMISKIVNSIGTINHVLLSDQQVLVQEKQKKRSEKNSSKTRNDIEVQLYLTENNCDDVIIQKTSCCAEVFLVGTLECQAFVHQKATVKYAINAVKCDLIRNLITRFQLFCEDLDEETLPEHEIIDNSMVTWALPKRVFAPICGGLLLVSDCVFKDEQPKDVLNRLSELLGVSLTEEELISREQFSDHVCADIIPDKNARNVTNVGLVEEKRSRDYKSIGALLTGVVTVVLAASIKFFWGE